MELVDAQETESLVGDFSSVGVCLMCCWASPSIVLDRLACLHLTVEDDVDDLATLRVEIE